MAELIDIYTEDGEYVGVADRLVAHTFALWHKTVHCWVVLADGRVVFQRRSHLKKDNPGKLYTTASGHLRAGETVEQGFVREIAEEIGLEPRTPRSIKQGKWSGDFTLGDGSVLRERVIYYMFFDVFDIPLSEFKFQDGEVDGVVAVSIPDFARLADGLAGSIEGEEFDGREVRRIALRPDDFCMAAGENIKDKYASTFKKIQEAMQ
ncbi:MAG: NUDIX domain-containing protein [Rickettsiales bacterium]|jgi:isopentenyldiphosphate isomerase|nr:NUDIX domain-containing protein [Rickettsiales bacterium]